MSTVPYTHIHSLYINGRWEKVQTGESVLNPATEAAIGHAWRADVLDLASL